MFVCPAGTIAVALKFAVADADREIDRNGIGGLLSRSSRRRFSHNPALYAVCEPHGLWRFIFLARQAASPAIQTTGCPILARSFWRKGGDETPAMKFRLTAASERKNDLLLGRQGGLRGDRSGLRRSASLGRRRQHEAFADNARNQPVAARPEEAGSPGRRKAPCRTRQSWPPGDER